MSGFLLDQIDAAHSGSFVDCIRFVVSFYFPFWLLLDLLGVAAIERTA